MPIVTANAITASSHLYAQTYTGAQTDVGHGLLAVLRATKATTKLPQAQYIEAS